MRNMRNRPFFNNPDSNQNLNNPNYQVKVKQAPYNFSISDLSKYSR